MFFHILLNLWWFAWGIVCKVEIMSISLQALGVGQGGAAGPPGEGQHYGKRGRGIPRAAAPNIMGNIKRLLKESCSNLLVFPIMFWLAAPRISHNVPPPPGLPQASLDPLGPPGPQGAPRAATGHDSLSVSPWHRRPEE